MRHPRSLRWQQLLALLAIATALLSLSTRLTEPAAHIAPAYAQQDVTAILDKPLRTEADYALLLRQTGLGRPAIDQWLAAPSGRQAILDCQRYYFAPVRYICTPNSPISREEAVINSQGQYAAATLLAPIQDGDILITSASHTFGWRNGHAALIVDAANGTTLESVVLGQNSSLQSVSKWTAYPNFLLLRPRDIPADQRAQIAQWAKAHLLDVPYDFTTGILSAKLPTDDITGTQCAHLVWTAYAHFGYDLDANGGPLVLPRDIAASPLLEIVQCYGREMASGWPR